MFKSSAQQPTFLFRLDHVKDVESTLTFGASLSAEVPPQGRYLTCDACN